MTRIDDVLRMATSAGVTVQVEGSDLVLGLLISGPFISRRAAHDFAPDATSGSIAS
jgi:hypothetical protein